MTDLGPGEKVWTKVVPACIAGLAWGAELSEISDSKKLQKALVKAVKGLDEAEFDVFCAQMVIKASGMGIVGTELTGVVEWFQGLRS